MKKPVISHRVAAVFSAAFLFHLAASSAYAANRYWSADGVVLNGSGTWDTTSLRWGSESSGDYDLAWVNGVDVAVLGTAAASNLTLGANITCGGIFAQNNSSTSGNINEGAGPFTLTLGVAGNNIFTAKQGDSAGRRLTINTVIAGATGSNVVLAGPATLGTGTMALNRANTYVGGTSFSGNASGAVNLTLGNQLALQNSTLTLSAACKTLFFNSTVAANAFTFGGLTAASAGAGRDLALQNNASSPAAIALSVGNNNASTTYAAVLSGSGSLTKIGTGTLTLSGNNTYSGTTTVNDGTLQGVVGGSCVNSKVILNNTLATLAVSVTDNTKTWTCKELAPTAAGTIEFNFGSVLPSNTVSPLTITVLPGLTGLADFSTATPKVEVNVTSGLPAGIYPLMTWDTVSGTIPATPDLILSALQPGTVATLEVSGNTLNLKITSTVATIVKANNITNLNLGGSWLGGVAPSATDLPEWNNTVNSANATNLGADLTWGGIVIDNPNGPITINPGNTLTLGSAATDIDMSAATNDLTLNCAFSLGSANTWNIGASRVLTFGGQVSGSSDITKLGDGTVVLSSGANSFSGNTTITAGTMRLGNANVIPHGVSAGNLTVNATLDLNGNSDTVNGISGNGNIDNKLAATSPTLIAGSNNQTGTFNGILKNTAGTLNFTKTGTGTLTLAGANTLGGTVTISDGTLALTNIIPFANASSIALPPGGILRADIANAVIDPPITLGAVSTTSTIHAPNIAGSGTTAVQFNLEGAITGAGDLTLKGVASNNAYSTINLKAASTYTGSTLITCSDELATSTTLGNQNIFVRLFVNDALPTSTVVTLDGGDGAPLASAPGRYCELNLSGKNQTIAGLTNPTTVRNLRVQRVVNSSATTSTLTINNPNNHTYSGQLGWVSGFGSAAYGNFNLTKSGAGTQTFSGPLRYDGHTTINGGTLSLGVINPFNDFANVTIAASAATLNLTFAGTDDVDKLFIGATQQLAGIYGAMGSGVQFEIPQITGTGTLTVSTGPNFASWINGVFTNGTIPLADQDPNDDFDKDGISNLIEYAISGQDPTVPNASVGTYTANTLSFTKRADAYGLTYSIQESTDLGVTDAWAEVPAGPSYTNNATTISYTLPGGPAKDFLRLRVTN
jgi:fibronectin-binding autotransporter adhesin